MSVHSINCDNSRSFRILLVDNNPEHRDLARQRISEIADYSIEVLQATRLSEAIATLERMNVDATLLGLDLPDSSGIETLRRLRDRRPDAAIVVIAGEGTEALCSMALQEGALDFLRTDELGSRLVTRTIVHALERLKAQKRQRDVEALLSVNPEAVVVVSADGIVELANEAAIELFGKGRTELADQEFQFPIAAGTVSEVQFVRHGMARTATMRIVDCEWNERPAYLASIRDTTEEKQLAEHLRTAQKMEAIGLLAGGVAHDFNNLLVVMTICTETLRDSLEPNNAHRADAEEILAAIARAQALTGQLLAFARHQPIEPRVVDLNAIVRGVHNLLRRALPANIEIQFIGRPDLWPVTMDPRRTEQVLMNLAVNARDAMPTGGKFTIELENMNLTEPFGLLQRGDYVSMRVSDNGGGIAPGNISRIFDPFFTTKGVGKGTGLGLATCYGIVRQADGDIMTKSEVGVGTTFTIMLPRAQETVVPAAEPQVMRSTALKGTETVVLVEDEPAVLRSTSRILRDAGYTIVEAIDGVAARAAIAREPKVDLVLTDVMMPKMGGNELAEHLAEDHPQLKILFMTGYSNDPDMNESANRHVLFKPFRSVDLLTKIREVLDTGRVTAAA